MSNSRTTDSNMNNLCAFMLSDAGIPGANKSLPGCLGDKNPRDSDVSDITELFSYFGFGEGTDVQKSILKKKLNGTAILDGAKGDLIDELGIHEDDINKFVKLRVALRKQDFLKREKIDLDKINAKSLLWDQVCQLLEEQVTAKDEKQRLKWYSYIEDETIDGEVLLKYDIDGISTELDLTKGQKTKYETLLEKMQGGSAQPKGGVKNTVVNNHSAVGAQASSGHNSTLIYNGNINVGIPENYGNKK